MIRNTWDRQYQAVWRERSQDTRIALVWRLASLAFGSHQRNGHASFGIGEVAEVLGITSQQLSNVIAEAKEVGLIDRRSCSRCLVVPPHAISYGPGEALAPCPYHDGKRVGRKRPKSHQTASVTPLRQPKRDTEKDHLLSVGA